MHRKKKILLLVPNLTVGGAERFMSLLANSLDKSKFEVHLGAINGANRFFAIDEAVHYYDLATVRVRHAVWRIRNLIKKVEPEVVLCTQPELNLVMGMFRFLFPGNFKLIARESTILKSLLIHSPNLKLPTFLNSLYKWFLPNIDTVVCQSEDMRASLLEMGVRHPNILVINNPVDVEAALEKGKVVYPEAFDIVTVGRLSYEKGYDNLIKLVHLYQEKYKRTIRIAIIGEGAERPMLEKHIEELGLEQNIFLLGWQKNPFQFYKKAKFFLMTSHYEGFPNVLTEAGCVGLPSVAFDAPGGIKEIIQNGKNGFMVEVGNMELMVDTIHKALHFPFDRIAIAEDTKNRFGLATIIHQYETLILKHTVNHKRAKRLSTSAVTVES